MRKVQKYFKWFVGALLSCYTLISIASLFVSRNVHKSCDSAHEYDHIILSKILRLLTQFKLFPETTVSYIVHFLYYCPDFINAYLIGSIPFGYILTKISGRGDIRDIGSGNMDASNVLRTGSKTLAILTFLGDFLKGFLFMVASFDFWESHTLFYYLCMMVMTLIGHMFPVWLNFKGGKGFAVYAGILSALSLELFGIAIGIWILMLLVSRYASLAAITSTLIVPFVGLLLPIPHSIYFKQDIQGQFIGLLLMTILVWWAHKNNIQRLIKGIEPKIGKKI